MHCDIQIFEWLIKYIKAPDSPPPLDVGTSMALGRLLVYEVGFRERRQHPDFVRFPENEAPCCNVLRVHGEPFAYIQFDWC